VLEENFSLEDSLEILNWRLS